MQFFRQIKSTYQLIGSKTNSFFIALLKYSLANIYILPDILHSELLCYIIIYHKIQILNTN